MLARDIMHRAVLSIGPGTPVNALEDFLVEHRVSGVAVVEGGRLIGVVSRADIVRALSLANALEGLLIEGLTQTDLPGADVPQEVELPPSVGKTLAGKLVRDVMSIAPITVRPDTPVREVAKLLVGAGVHRVFVVDAGTLAGVITSLDLVREVATGSLAATESLEAVPPPAP